MNPIVLMSIPIALGAVLIVVGLLPTIYELGSTELERRGETTALAQTSRLRELMSLLDWEESHPAAHWLVVLGAGACSVIIAVVLAARGGSLERVLAFGQSGLAVVFLVRGEYFEGIAQKLLASFRRQPNLTGAAAAESEKLMIERSSEPDA